MGKTAIVKAKTVYFFKETFRFHSKEEYREFFSRGLHTDNSGLNAAFPWVYIRVFFGLFVLFTLNVLVLRLTDNPLFVPSVLFLGGTAITVPFIVFLYELYPRRDVSLFFLMLILVAGGTAASLLSQIGYQFIPVKNAWISAVVAGCLEELCKALPAIIAIELLKQRNPYACFLIAAAVGAGFSIIEDMGYIFYYSDRYFFEFHSDIQATVAMFADRGLSAFCTHIMWTGAIGWAYSALRHPLKSMSFFAMAVLSVALHICWDLPLTGLWMVLDITACVIVAAACGIAIVNRTRVRALRQMVDEEAVNAHIIRRAKAMSAKNSFINAANLTASIVLFLLSVLILAACAMPIGTQYRSVDFDSPEEYLNVVQRGFNLTCNWDREFDYLSENYAERRYEEDRLVYVVQASAEEGYDGLYYYGYSAQPDGTFELEDISVELEVDGSTFRYMSKEYDFGQTRIWGYLINTDYFDYTVSSDGTVHSVTSEEVFLNNKLLIAMCAAGCGIAAGGTLVILSLLITLKRLKDA